VADITLLAYRVTINTNADLIDVTNFESGADAVNNLFYGDYIGGVVGAEVNVEAYESDDLDGNNFWFAGLKAGVRGTDLRIYTSVFNNVVNSRRWKFPNFSVIDVSTQAEAHGAVKHMLRVLNDGLWYYPGQGAA